MNVVISPDRREPRCETHGQIHATCVGGTPVDVRAMVDLSAGGFSIRPATTVAAGTRAYFELRAGGVITVTCPATAKYCRPSTSGYVSGWQFGEDADREAIGALLRVLTRA